MDDEQTAQPAPADDESVEEPTRPMRIEDMFDDEADEE